MLHSLLELTLGKRLPKVDGTLRVPGVHAPVVIRRDEHGIPYIEAQNDADAFLGMGFCQVQDRSFQMELYLRVARGTLAEVLGDDMLPVDRLMRRLGLQEIAKKQFALLEPREQAQLIAFSHGVNAGIAQGSTKQPHEFTLLGMKASRFEPTDIIAVLQFFAFALSSNWDAELARLRILRGDGPDALHALEASHPEWSNDVGGLAGALGATLATDVDALAIAEKLADEVSLLSKVTGLGGASNAWAVAPSRTKSGRAILACDPHLSPSLPSPWYLLHVRTPNWAMSGACLPGNPIPTFGHNDHVAWAITAGHVDNTDLFLERISPEDNRSVRDGDGWHFCERRDERIFVKGKKEPVIERVLVTPRGPIVSPMIGGQNIAISLRGTWMAPRRLGGYQIYTIKNVDEACAIFASYPSLSENRVFADTGGRIAWHMVGDAPVRKQGAGMLPTPGWDPQCGWEDEPLPYDSLPHEIDPESGIVASANQYPGRGKDGAFLGADWLDGSRYARIMEIVGARHDWDVTTTLAVQTDRKTLLWGRIRDVVLSALRDGSGDEGEERREEITRALQWLEAWDGIVSAGSTSASIYEVFFAEMVLRVAKAKAPRFWRAAIGQGTNVVLPHGIMALRRIDHLARLLIEQPKGFFAHGWPAEMRDAMHAALQTLRRAGGKNDRAWAWGRLRPVYLVHAVGTQKPLDRVWNRGPLAFGGDATTIPQASVAFDTPLGNAIGVPNLRAVMDVGSWENSRFVLAGGQSGNPLSPHYDDMVNLWLRGETVSMAWAPDKVKSRARSTLTLSSL